jgi:hypothetical protein
LDLPRLIGQLVGLERRVARGGRDSIAHAPGSHDDVANAVCGALVQVISDRRPALVKQNQLLVDDAPAPLPSKCDLVIGVMAADDSGMCAVIYCVVNQLFGIPLILWDFEVEPVSADFFMAAVQRVHGLEEASGARNRLGLLFAPEGLALLATTIGLRVNVIPAPMCDLPSLTTASAMHISAHRVKIGAAAAERAQSHPFGGALDFKPGTDLGDDPLRAAALFAIVVMLQERRDFLIPAT